MSRVYEALRKAERQRAAAEAQAKESDAPAAAFGPHEILKEAESQRADHDEARERARLAPPAAIGPLESDRVPGVRALPTAAPEHLAPPNRGDGGPLVVMDRAQYAMAAEQFSLLAARLQRWAAKNEKRVFMVTSSVSGEGKSFVALNLAMTLARDGNRVVLVDADLRVPTLHHAFNLAPLHGLLDYLEGAIDLRACLQPTSVSGLLLVTAGGRSRSPTEALARPRMREFLAEACSMAPPHYVIVDAPATSAVPEPQILCQLVDALVLVVAANSTPRELVRQTIERVEGTKIFGTVLNRFEPPHSSARRYRYKYSARMNGRVRKD